MLNKLLKYEFKSLSRVIVPLLIGLLALALLLTAALNVNIRVLDKPEYEGTVLANFMDGIFGLLVVVSVLALIVACFAILFLVLQRYYKNFFGDEGYLTFTLPANTDSQLWAKILSAFIWALISGFVLIVALALVIFVGASGTGVFTAEFFSRVGEIFTNLTQSLGVGRVVLGSLEIILFLIVSILAQTLFYYLAITIGCVAAKKQKLLASVGFYLLINFAIGTVSSAVQLIFMGNSALSGRLNNALVDIASGTVAAFDYLAANTGINLVLYAGLGVAAYFVCRSLIKNRLNLE